MSQQAAALAAKALCEKLGAGWKPRVWNNLGWHYTAVLEWAGGGMAEVREETSLVTDKATYRAQIRPGVAAGGREAGGARPLNSTLQYWGDGDSPKAAFAVARSVMEQDRKRLSKAFAAARRATALLSGGGK